MYLYFLFSVIFLPISQATPGMISDIGTVDDDSQLLIDSSSTQNFPIYDDTLVASSENNLPIKDPSTAENLTPTEGLSDFAATELSPVPDMSQEDIYQLAETSQPLNPSCDLNSQNCIICHRTKAISPVCEIAEKVTHKVVDDTLCIHGSVDKCVPFDSLANLATNLEGFWWDVKAVWNLPYTRLPEKPGKMRGFCRRVDVLVDCKICTDEEKSDCIPAHWEKENGAGLICDEKDGCVHLDN